MPQRILTINAGSSSIKFALFEGTERRISGTFERMGQPDGKLTPDQAQWRKSQPRPWSRIGTRAEAVD